MQADREGLVELVAWDYHVLHPFLQLVTDLQRGGMAYWCEGVEASNVSASSSSVAEPAMTIIRRHTFGSMQELYEFVAKAVCALPANVALPGQPRQPIYKASTPQPWQQHQTIDTRLRNQPGCLQCENITMRGFLPHVCSMQS